MKKTDIAMLILIASISVITAYFVASSFLGDLNQSKSVKTIDEISSAIADPDPKIFNKDAINPAVQVEIKGAN
jgi:uncharacterized protein YggT (Ycf19 family)